MEFIQLVNTRFSVRKFKNRPVELEKLQKVLEAGKMAPSAANFQPWHFIVIEKKEALEKIWPVYKRPWIREAPVIIVACSDHDQSWRRGSDGKDSADIDISIAVDHMTLQAAELEMGTCWVCNFDVVKCSDILNIPQHIEPVALIPLGYPDTEIPAKKRKSLDEIVHWNTF